MKKDKVPFETQIFVCTNDRKGERPSCGDQQGEAVFAELRRIAKERGHHPKIRVAQAKCLGQCSIGCNIMVYPQQVWYSAVTLAHVPEIAAQYLPAK